MDEAADDVTVDVLLRVWRERWAEPHGVGLGHGEDRAEVEADEREGAPEWLAPRRETLGLAR